MGKQREEMAKTGPEATERLRALFARWAKEEAEGLYDDEPSWEEIRDALDEEREREGAARRLFPEES
jgi:hypothetical protein